MLTKTSLKNPSTLKKVKEAILDAVRSASVHPSGLTVVSVYNSKDKHFLDVVGIKGRSYKVSDSEGTDITPMVNEALRVYHAEGNK